MPRYLPGSKGIKVGAYDSVVAVAHASHHIGECFALGDGRIGKGGGIFANFLRVCVVDLELHPISLIWKISQFPYKPLVESGGAFGGYSLSRSDPVSSLVKSTSRISSLPVTQLARRLPRAMLLFSII